MSEPLNTRMFKFAAKVTVEFIRIFCAVLPMLFFLCAALPLSAQTTMYSGIGETNNQREIGRYLDRVSTRPVGDFRSVLRALDALPYLPREENEDIFTLYDFSADTMRQRSGTYALDQMAGAVYGTETSASFQNTTLLHTQLSNVLRRDPVGWQPDAKDHLWGMIYGHAGKSESDGNANAYRQGFAGILLGLDKINERYTRLGMYLSAGEGSLSSDLLDRGISKELMLGYYIRQETRNGYILAGMGIGNHSYDTRRQITFLGRTAENRHNAFLTAGYFEAGLRYQGNIVNWYPYIGGQYIGMLRQGFSESGAGSVNLTADKEDYQSVRPVIGIRFDAMPFRFRYGTLAFYGNTAWMYEFDSKKRYTEFTARFTDLGYLNGASFTVNGNDPNHDWVTGGFGVNYDLNQRFRGFAGYDAYANRRQVLHSANLGFVYQR